MALSDDLADDITTHAVNILRVAAGMRDDVLGMLKSLSASLVKDIEENPRQAALLKQANATIASAYSDISEAHAANLSDISHAETRQAANLVNHAIGVDLLTVGQTPKQLEAIAGKTLLEGHYPSQWWAGQSKDLQNRFAGEMRTGMLKGESIDQLVQRIRGKQADGYQGGIMQASRAQAEALVRTSVQSVSNESRINTYRENGDVIKGIQWLSTLDSRTTAICRALDGLTWDLDLQPIGHDKAFPGPIAHWGCRSTQIPITKSWSELSGKKITVDDETITKGLQDKAKAAGMDPAKADKLIARTRASMDGQVAAKTTFDDWMKGKSEAFQDQVLGRQQAQLYRTGKITMADLTDQGNRPLSIAALQKLATEKQLLPPATTTNNQGGMTLHQRQIAEDLLANLVANSKEMTTYLNDETGDSVTVDNSTVTDDNHRAIAEADATTVIKTALTAQDILTIPEARTFQQAGVEQTKVVLLNGSTIQISGTFDKAKVDPLIAKLSLKSNAPTEKKLLTALREAGFDVIKTQPGTITIQAVKSLATIPETIPGIRPSQGKVKFGDGVEKQTAQAFKDTFGRDLQQVEMASLFGIPDNGEAEIYASNYGTKRKPAWSFDVNITGPNIASATAQMHDKGDQIEIHIGTLYLEDPNSKAHGNSLDALATMVNQAVKLKVDVLTTDASGYLREDDGNGVRDTGYRTWPRMGFDAEIPEHIRGTNDMPDAKTISDLMATSKGQAWWKQNGYLADNSVDNGATVAVEFDLSPGSLSIQTLAAFVAKIQRRGGE